MTGHNTQQHMSTRGFTLVEMLVYIGVLALVALGSVTALLSLDELLAQHRAEQLVLRSATTALERILLDIRSSDTVVTAVGTHPGSLTLVQAGVNRSYQLSGVALEVLTNGVSDGLLTEEGVAVTNVQFYGYSSTTEMVRVALTLSATVGDSTATRNFNAGAVLRGSYE